MATNKNITMKQFNGTDYDTLYPKTKGSQITGAVPITSGGTGGTNAKTGMYNLLNGMSTITPATNDLFPFKDVSGSTSGLVTLTNLITTMGNNGVITTSNLNTQVSNLGFSKIQTGSYVGTGTYGASNPCSLTFDSIPKVFVMLGYKSGNSIHLYFGEYHGTSADRWAALTEYWTTPTGFGAPKSSGLVANIYRENKTIYWYSESGAEYMYNNSGVTYYWMAFC